MNAPVTSDALLRELTFTTSRSGGPGGQHVNKVSSKVTLKWNVSNSKLLSAEQRELLLEKWSGLLTSRGVLIVYAQESRSQQTNKESVRSKLDALLRKAFATRKARKATKPSMGSVQKRVEEKRQRSEIKKMRRKPVD